MSVMITTGAPTEVEPEVGTVAYEAARLDRLFPGWHERVDPESLYLPSMRLCVLGQAVGSFRAGWEAVSRDQVKVTARHIDLYCFPEFHHDWIAEIEKRR